jgi:hypothetical protein
MRDQAEPGSNQAKRPLRYGLISALLALGGLGVAMLSGELRRIAWLLRPPGIVFSLFELAALCVALIGAIRATWCKALQGDRSLLILGGGLAFVLVVLGLRPVLDWGPGPRAEIIAQQTEAAELEELGRAMMAYSRAHNGRYPAPEKWCDALTTEAKALPPGSLHCLRGEGRCRYAMNPLADPCSASDVVLLFECRDGWNRFGGPEILTARWQHGGSCTVLFVSGKAGLIETEKITFLKWEGRARR